MTRYQTPILQADAMPRVALESMNETHTEELALVNRLAELLASAMAGVSNEQAVTNALTDWVQHTQDHFARENRLMEQFDFPAYPVHRDEHARVLALIEELQRNWMDSRQAQPLATFLFEQWPQWFDQHVNSMDAVTAQFLRQRGA